MKEVRVEIRVKNNVIYKNIQNLGLSLKQFSEKTGFNYQDLIDYVAFRTCPFYTKNYGVNHAGDWKSSAKRLAELMSIPIEKLFPEELYRKTIALEYGKKRVNLIVKEISKERALTMPGPMTNIRAIETDSVEKDALALAVQESVSTLDQRERTIIEARFGLTSGNEGLTHGQLSKKFRISRERIRQIELKAITKLRHPLRSEPLREYRK